MNLSIRSTWMLRTIALALVCGWAIHPQAFGIGLQSPPTALGADGKPAKPATSSAAKPGTKPGTKSHKRRAAVKPVVAALPERPPDPPPPDWPANHPASPASVDWNGRVLKIAATNSSLQQILNDVSTATGVKLEGSTGDQRVYGNYGPAPAREVIRQLLDGSGYNVLMIGDQGQGTPRRLVLTSKVNHGPAPRPAANADPQQGADDQPEEQPEPPEQPTAQPMAVPPNPPGSQNRTPQEIQQELIQRQQQMQQQQQQAQPGQTPN